MRRNFKRGKLLQMDMEFIKQYRQAHYEIDPVYLKRWSSRSFTNEDVPEDILYSLFEAARWAPSAGNHQPWRFIIARSETDRKKFLTFMKRGNATWCDKAPVLVAVVSQKKWEDDDKDYNPTHAFDTGAAWGFLAMEATRKGLVAHAMGGFDREKAKATLNIPKDYDVHAIIAIGYRGDKQNLSPDLQARENPSTRKSIKAFISEGTFK